MNHCVLYRSNLKYDGRVSTIIRTLALSYPDDNIFLYEYPESSEYYSGFPENVQIIKCNFILNKLKRSYFIQVLKGIEYTIKSLFFLLRKRPKTIQIHHETVMLSALLYKFFFNRVKLVYDDKELYHLRDKNIPTSMYWMEYCLIKKSDLVITCNYYRTKALKFIHQNKLINNLIIDNFLFKDNSDKNLSIEIQEELNILKKNNKKILLHQGTISENRGENILKEISCSLPNDWILVFIGVDNRIFSVFSQKVGYKYQKNIHNLGFINYNELNSLYKLIDACILVYDDSSFNNKYCAPNRLYAAVDNGCPIIVNWNNKTLSNFVIEKQNGILYKDIYSLENFFKNYDKFSINSKKYVNKYEYNLYIPSLLDYYNTLKT